MIDEVHAGAAEMIDVVIDRDEENTIVFILSAQIFSELRRPLV